MKIAVVLCSLATVAIAVPVYQENVFESSLSTQPSKSKRARKSTLFDITSGLLPEHGIERIPIPGSKQTVPETSIETKGFRRPIIIKRKLGYHVYRDSDEEKAHAEPGEKCREQVKFKLCDHEPVSSSKNGIKSPTFKCMDNYKTDNEMENSIKMAKEAVEYLQRDLKRMEKFSAKISQPHIEDIDSNTGLHHDIEIAREALEHIEQSFEPVNTEVNKVNELQIPKSQDEERLNRWREAIENINKNFEIVKNIEDAFKSDNHFSLFRSDNIKTIESGKTEYTNDKLENNEKVYKEGIILKSASNEGGIAQLTPIRKNVGNDVFIFPMENREENIQLHSDSLKSDINSKGTSLRSELSEKESTKYDDNISKELIEYAPKNSYSLSEVSEYSENEKGMDDHVSDHHELLPKTSSSSSDTLEENLNIENPKTLDKSELMMKTALPEKENTNRLIQMKSVKEIFENKKDQVEVPTRKEENINEYEEQLFKSENENSPLERVNSVQKSTIIEASENPEASDEENKNSDKHYNKVVEENENKSKSYNTNMRLSNDQLEETKQLSADNFISKDQNNMQSPHLFSPKEKNVFSGEEHTQNEHKTPNTIKENNQFYDSLKESEQEVKDETQNFKDTDEYKNYKSSEVQDEQIGLRTVQNQELNEFTFLNDDSVLKVVQKDPDLYKTVSEASNDQILKYRDQSAIPHSIEEEMSLSITQPKDGNDNRQLQYSKSVPEMHSDPMVSMPTENVDVTDDDNIHKSEENMRLSQTQNEKLRLNKYQEGAEYASTRADIEDNSDDTKSQFLKSVPEMQPNSIATLATDNRDVTNDQQSYREEASIRSSESQNEKMQSSENQDVLESLSMGLDRHPEERTWQLSKSVPELPYDPLVSMLTEKVDTKDDSDSRKEEASMRSSESQNEKLQSNENKEVHEPLLMGLDIERRPEERSWQLSKSVPELPYEPMASMLTEKVDITENQPAHNREASVRSSESQYKNLQLNEYQEKSELPSTRLDIGNDADDTTFQLFKSVPEMQLYPIASLPTDKVDITDDQQVHKEEASMRSSESQNEKMQSNQNLEVLQVSLPVELDSKARPEERTLQLSKSASELSYDPLVSMLMEKVDITDDSDSHKGETSMRFSESQNEKLQSNENQELHETFPIGLDIEHYPEGRTWQLSKSVPELFYDPMVSKLTEKVDVTDDPDAHKGEASMRSSESQTEKLQLNENQEVLEPLPMELNSESSPLERTWQLSKSVSDPFYDPLVSMLTKKADITDDSDAHKKETSMRSSESQNEKLQSNENQELHEPLLTGLNIERHPEERTWHFSKSVPELPYDQAVSMLSEKVNIAADPDTHEGEGSMRSSESQNGEEQLSESPEKHDSSLIRLDIEDNQEGRTWSVSKSVPELHSDSMVLIPADKVDITNEQQFHMEEVSMRSAKGQNEKKQFGENQELHEPLSMGLDIERYPEESKWQLFKSVPELPYDPMVSRPMEKDDITDDQRAHEGEVSKKSSEDQYEKLQLNKYQEEPEPASTRFDIENNSDDSKSLLFKSVPELQPISIATLATSNIDVTNDQQSYREEASIRSSENQNEKMQTSENQDMQDKTLLMGLDIDRHPEERTWQLSKSVPELPYDPLVSMLTEKVDTKDDSDSRKEETSMRSSESQNEKLQSNENKEVHEPLLMGLDIERRPEERTWQLSKSVPELPYDPLVSMLTEKVDAKDDSDSHKEEANMRSSESQNEKLQSNENQGVHEPLLVGLNIEHRPEERTWQLSKSVPELPYDPMVSMPTEKITHDPDPHNGETSIRSSESQNDKLQLNEYQEESEHPSTRLDIENNSDDTKSQFSKSVPEVLPDPMASLTTDQVDITNDQQSYREEASMRSSESQNEKMHSNENQGVHEPLLMGLDIERHPQEPTIQLSKSVSELSYDPVSVLTDEMDITDDKHSQESEASMRSSESQNEKVQLNEYYEDASKRLGIETNSDDTKSQFLKSVPELQPHPIASLATDKGDNTNDQMSYGEETSMRSSENQNEKMQSNNNQEVHETLMMRSDMTNHPENPKWPFSKSVPESSYDSMVSMPTDNVDTTNEQHILNKGNMRLSQNQNERSQFDDSHRLHDYLPTKLGNENHAEHITSQFLKSSPELHMRRSNVNVNNGNFYFTEDARLSQNQNEREQTYFNHHLYEPLSSRLDIEKKIQDDSAEVLKSVQDHSENMLPLAANNIRFSYIQNPTSDQTIMRLSQNQNENKEIQYPSMSLGLSNELMSRKDNAEHIMNDFMPLSVAQHQRLHENSHTMLRSSNERQHLSPNFKSLPENKMLLPTSQFDFSNGQNVNMRINHQQSREPEQMDNQNLYNSMRWNTENQHQDLFPKSFKSISDFDHTLHRGNEFENEQFIPHEVSKMGNTQEYRTRPQLLGDHILEDTQSSRWVQSKQHNDHFANYYKSIPEVHDEYTNPHFRNNLNRVALNQRLNDVDTFNRHDFPSNRARLHDHMQKYHQEKSSNIDSSMEPGMNMGMGEPFAKPGTEFNNMHFNHPHGTARFGLPIAGVNPGAVGVFPTANAGGCGIPLLLSCSPSVVSGSLARSPIAGPIFKSGDEHFKYHIKRDAKNFADTPVIKVQKTSLPYNHGTGTTNEI